jgi:hypothetical protein
LLASAMMLLAGAVHSVVVICFSFRLGVAVVNNYTARVP